MKWFVFCQESVLLCKQHDGSYALPQRRPSLLCGAGYTLPPLRGNTDSAYPLCYCCVEHLQDVPRNYALFTVREAFHLLSQEDYVLLVKYKEIATWDKNTRFCPSCGAALVWQTTIAKKCCTCGREMWAQVSPAIIVLIHRCRQGDDGQHHEIVMVHAHNFVGSHYGLVAGYVEPGETLEEAVQRECHEEVGLQVDNIRYVRSQAWPFPSNLMVAFTATYVSGEIVLQRSELAAGGWYDLRSLPLLPHPASIAYQLIEEYKKNLQ